MRVLCPCTDLQICKRIKWDTLYNCIHVLTNLPIREDGGIVALKAALDESLRAVGVDSFLLGVHIKDVVIGEGLIFTQDHLGLPRHHVCTDVTTLNLFFGQLRTNPGRKEDVGTYLIAHHKDRFLPALMIIRGGIFQYRSFKETDKALTLK